MAVAIRLFGSLRGSGLYGLGNYDDGVHVAAALGLVNGLLPYRDFLLLHPPGVVLVLAPFAALSWLIGEPDAMAVARVSWMVLGGVNAVLCALVLRPVSRAAGVLAGLFYALSIGAIYVEHTALLEPPATTVLLAALVTTRLLGSGDGITTRRYVIAGLLLGMSPVLKIWGIVAVLVVVAALLARRGRRPALIALGAAAASCVAGCLPFFVAAPQEMWRMVVLAQIGRRRIVESPVQRLRDVLGTREWEQPVQWWVVLLIMIVVVSAAGVACLLRAELRVVAALLLTHGALVATTPMWFLHYAGLTAAPIAVTLGGGLAVLISWCARPRWLPRLLVGAAIVGIVVLALPLRNLDLGDRRFPAERLAPAVVEIDGCVTTDWPMILILLDRQQRDLDRGCRFVVDLGGYSYYATDSPYHLDSRRKNLDWQALALAYYRSGEAAIPVRFSTDTGFSEATARELDRWPVIAKAGRYTVLRPEHSD